jgi:1-aminocyclopropane-1-carboxylate deaminase/D-cysteine desulfhydrase-like pyridoxal-dependent ACC family enzyme
MIEAVRMLAETEAILMDPVYNGIRDPFALAEDP